MPELVPESVPEWHSTALHATFLSPHDAKNEPPLSIRLCATTSNRAPPASRAASAIRRLFPEGGPRGRYVARNITTK